VGGRKRKWRQLNVFWPRKKEKHGSSLHTTKNISKNLEKLLRAHAVSLAYEMMVGLYKNRRGSI